MISRLYSSLRADLGGVALGLGCIGLFLLAVAVPFTIFEAHFWGGFGFHEGPQPTPAQYDAAVSHQLWWSVWHRLVPLLVISICLIGYGFYEAYKEKQNKK
jgi:hypothetical protein